jgi:hypothetical protein
MCLYGRDPFYVEGAFINAVDARHFYPDWQLWLYINRNHTALKRFQDLPHIRVIEMPVSRFSEGTGWRFLPDLDPAVSHVIYRDADCRFSDREVCAVQEWLESSRTAHVMFTPWHNGMAGPGACAWKILAGLWGMKTGKVPVGDLYQRWFCANPNQVGYGADQNFLGDVRVKKRATGS